MGELIHGLGQSRAIPALGTGIGLPVVVASLLGDAEWHRWVGLAGAALIAVGHLAKLATDLNGLGRFTRTYNAQQDGRIAKLEQWARAKGFEPEAKP